MRGEERGGEMRGGEQEKDWGEGSLTKKIHEAGVKKYKKGLHRYSLHFCKQKYIMFQGEIPLTDKTTTEIKNFQIFFVNTPNRKTSLANFMH